MSLDRYSRILSPYRANGRFYNQPHEQFHNVVGHSLIMFMHLFRDYKKRRPADKQRWIHQATPVERCQDLTITWVGHSTFLIQINGINILTDPLFGNSSVLFPRILPPGIAIEQLPPIDYIILSHNHIDHMGGRNLRVIKQQSPDVKVLVPEGDKQWFDKRGFSFTREHTWWDQYVDSSVTFTFLPAFHWSQRGLFDRNRSLWGSWMIEIGGKTLYFGGDTAYWKHFPLIAEAFPSIDVTFMPVGPCEPQEWMEQAHISAELAGKAFLELGARHFIPMHWGTFYFGEDLHEGPINRIKSWWDSEPQQLADKKLHILKVGEPCLPETQMPIITPESIITL